MSAPRVRFAAVLAAERTEPLRRALAAALPKLEIEVAAMPSYAALGDALVAGSVELGWAPPQIAARAEAAEGRALLQVIRGGQAAYRSALVVRRGAELALRAGAGLRAVWVDPQSTSGYALPRAWIQSAGIDPAAVFSEERFAGSPGRALQELAQGRADVTAIFAAPEPADPLARVPAEFRQEVELLAVTGSSPSDAIVASAALGTERAEYVLRRLLAAIDEPHGEALLALLEAEGLRPAPPGAYRALAARASPAGGALGERACALCGAALPPSTRFCGQCGHPAHGEGRERQLTPSASPGWQEERKLAVVLFADMVGFTTISDRFEPEQVRELANACFEPLTREIEGHGGAVIKYIGDCIMAAFGVPTAAEGDPRRAVQAALGMGARLAEISRQLEDRYGLPIRMRIGLEWGTVMVGTVGASHSAAVDLMGSTVNLASRIQGAGHPGEVVVGPALHRLVVPWFVLEPLGAAALKGISEPVPLFRVLRERAPEDTPLALGSDGGVRLREPELQQLLAASRTALAGAGAGVVKLWSEAGLGRGRLLGQLSEALAEDAGGPPLQLVAGAVPSATSSAASLAFFGQILRRHFAAGPGEPPERIRERIAAAAAEAFEDPRAIEARETGEILAALCGIGHAAPALAEPRGATDRIFAAVSAWLGHLARTRPLALILNDLQWADPASLELLERLIRFMQHEPALFVLAGRPELQRARPGWPSGARVALELPLEPLPAERMRAFVRHMLARVGGAAPELEQAVVERAEGNPEFARELVRLVADRGGFDPAVARALPESIQVLLQARLDQLPAPEKELLKRAAVVGGTFWVRPLVELARLEGLPEVEPMLADLEVRGLIEPRPEASLGTERAYAFKTGALREIAYRAIPLRARQLAHRQVARWLEERELGPQGASELAGHLEAAGAVDEARRHWLAAGEQSLSVHASREAAGFLRKALDGWSAPANHPLRSRALRLLARAQTHLGEFEPALAALDEAKAALPEAGEPGAELAWATFELERARVLKEAGRVDAALGALDSAVAREIRSAADPVAALIRAERAFLRMAKGDLAGAQDDCEAGQNLAGLGPADDTTWRTARAVIANTLGGVFLYRGKLADAETCFEQGRVLGEAGLNQRARMMAHVNLGAIAFSRGELPRAASHFEQALMIARKTDRVRDIASWMSNLGETRLALGEIDEAVRLLAEAWTLVHQSKLDDLIPEVGPVLADAYRKAGERGRALEVAEAAVDAASKAALPWQEAMARIAAIRALLAGGRQAASPAVQDHLERARERLRASGRADAEREIEKVAALVANG